MSEANIQWNGAMEITYQINIAKNFKEVVSMLIGCRTLQYILYLAEYLDLTHTVC